MSQEFPVNCEYKVNDMVLSATVPNLKLAFMFRAKCDELFGITACGNCGHTDLKWKCRTARSKEDGSVYTYYSVECQSCGHELKFSVRKLPGEPLYPKGWEPPYKPKDATAQAPAQSQATPSDEFPF